MIQPDKLLKTLLLLVITTVSNPAFPADSDTRGKITGGVLHPPPAWFKESFLEIADDVDGSRKVFSRLRTMLTMPVKPASMCCCFLN
jgi:hypothetical protein